MKKIIALLFLLTCFVGLLILNVHAATTRIETDWLYNNVGYAGDVTIGSSKKITVTPIHRDGTYGAFKVSLPSNTAYKHKKITLYAYTTNFLGISTNRGNAILYDHSLGWPLASDVEFNMPIKITTGATYDATPSFSMPLTVTNRKVSFKIVSSGLNKGWYEFKADVSQ